MKIRIKSIPKANNGLSIEGNQFTPLSEETIMLGGKSHKDGGTDISFLGKTVEAEKGEPVSIDARGNAIVWGNLDVPFTNKKFKTVAKEIGKKEAKNSNLRTKASELIKDNDPFNQFSSLKFNTGVVLEDAANQTGRELFNLKQDLGDLQQQMLDIADATGKKPEQVSKVFKNGGKLVPKMREGGSVAERHNNPGNIKFASWLEKYGATKGQAGTDGGNFAQFPTIEAGQRAMIELLNKPRYRNQTVEGAIKTWTGGSSYGSIPNEIRNKKISDLGQDEFSSLLNTITKGEDSKLYNWEGALGSPYAPMRNFDMNSRRLVNNTPSQDSAPSLQFPDFSANPDEIIDPSTIPTPAARNTPDMSYMTSYGSPYQQINNRPSSQTNVSSNRARPSIADNIRLNPLDFANEIGAIFDRPDYVQGQQFDPLLLQPYQVSFQDRLNQNNSTFRALAQQLPNNPEALSALAAQRYEADNQALAEQFRTNQQIANTITNQNTGILNQAAMTNLQLADIQYERQERARANTQSRRDQALSSISNKFGRNRRDRTTAQLLESRSDFRLSPEGTLNYYGDPASFLVQQQMEDLKAQQKLASQSSTKKWGGYVKKTK